MAYKDVMKWNTRLSAAYALGAWTIVGSLVYLKYTGRFDDLPVKKEEEAQEQGDQIKVVYENAYFTSTTFYKKDFVPYTTRIYNFIKSFSSEPGTGDK